MFESSIAIPITRYICHPLTHGTVKLGLGLTVMEQFRIIFIQIAYGDPSVRFLNQAPSSLNP